MNKALLIGNISNDLELKKTQSGKSLLDFKVAVNEGYGEKKTTDFIKCRAWERTAELISNYCRKGSKIYVEGRCKSESYEKNGQKMYADYVLVNNVEFLDSKPAESKRTLETRPKWDYQETLTGDGRDATGFKVSPDDLPFF